MMEKYGLTTRQRRILEAMRTFTSAGYAATQREVANAIGIGDWTNRDSAIRTTLVRLAREGLIRHTPHRVRSIDITELGVLALQCDRAPPVMPRVPAVLRARLAEIDAQRVELAAEAEQLGAELARLEGAPR